MNEHSREDANTVWKVVHEETGEIYCIKKINGWGKDFSSLEKEIFTQVHLLRRFDHHNIIQLQEVIWVPEKQDEFFFIFEYMGNELIYHNFRY